jgi:hypothetical protein
LKRLSILAVATGAAMLTLGVVLAGAAGPRVSTPVNVTNSLFAANEESLGMDPSGTLLAGAWNDWHFNDGCGFSYSTDGGDTWAPESFVPGLTSFTNDPNVPGLNLTFAVAGDPSVAYNPKFGDFVVMCQAFGSATGNQIQLLSTTFDPASVTNRNDTNGSYGLGAWRLPATAVATGASNGSQKGSHGHFPDHESITVDTNPTSPFYGRVYAGWAEFSGFGRSPIDVAFSDDDGATWTGPIRVSDNGHQFDQDARPSVAPNGDVYMTWVNGPNEGSLKNNVAMADVSHDGGAHWGADVVASPIVSPYAGGLPNSLYRVSTDVWSTTDATGRLIVVYTDNSTGASQVWATHALQANTLTGGFATAARVNPTGQEQFFPWLSAAPNGRVDLVYYDRSCDPSGDKLNCVTLSSTSDGGASWSKVPLLGTGFDGDKFEACVAFLEPPDCGNHFLGDYIAVASTDSKAQALWTGNGSHAADVFSARAIFH